VPSSGPYFALTPLLTALGYVSPTALQALATAVTIVLALIEAHRRSS
jgi:hypothetical protein